MWQLELSNIAGKVAAAIFLIVVVGLTQPSDCRGQDTRLVPVTISGVSSHATANGTVVSIDANGPLNRAQTWQDREGYHVVVPAAGTRNAIKAGSGIKVRQLDHSLEIVIQTRPGANVTVQAMANRLNLNVEGKLDPNAADVDSQMQSDKAQRVADNLTNGTSSDGLASQPSKTSDKPATDHSTAGSGSQAGELANQPLSPDSTQNTQRQIPTATGESSVMSDTTVLVVLGVACLGGLLIVRRWKSSQASPAVFDDEDFQDMDNFDGPNSSFESAKANSSSANALAVQRKSTSRLAVAMPASLYGAYQVDLEISKLVQGQPHRMDVVASRAPDDRRAIEASLLKALNATAGDEEMQRRVRNALEEYGFVARQSAALLAAPDPFERSSAARMLGDAKSSSSLPFLLEALYDSDALVRNQAVLSIGELKMPSAIGALLDIARKHPDVPGSLLSKALNACSLEGLDFFDASVPDARLLSGVDYRLLAEEIFNLEPAAAAEELPESTDDEGFVKALTLIQSEVITDRSEAIKSLAQFCVRQSVDVLAQTARSDKQSSLRAAAISSLAAINHQSVFPAVLIAMADESREVRAAAARSLSRLSFDRADAYVRVSRAGDVETLRSVAEACVKAGIATQGIDRMITGDHQAYEAMSVVLLLMKAQAIEPLLNAAINHPNVDVRLSLTYLLGLTGDQSLIEPLQELLSDSPSEAMTEALSEAVANLKALHGETGENEAETSSHDELETSCAVTHNEESEVTGEADVSNDQPESGPNQPVESEMSTGFDFEFAPALDREDKVEVENEPEPPQLEGSGLPAPPIA